MLTTKWRLGLAISLLLAPAAAIKWPVMLLVLDTGTWSACGPKTARQANDSTRSLTAVLVPWAFT